MKRLYNEYSACPHEGNAARLSAIMTEAFEKVWEQVVNEDDVCPRDAESLCHSTISVLFAENILRRAMKKRAFERNTNKGVTQ